MRRDLTSNRGSLDCARLDDRNYRRPRTHSDARHASRSASDGCGRDVALPRRARAVELRSRRTTGSRRRFDWCTTGASTGVRWPGSSQQSSAVARRAARRQARCSVRGLRPSGELAQDPRPAQRDDRAGGAGAGASESAVRSVPSLQALASTGANRTTERGSPNGRRVLSTPTTTQVNQRWRHAGGDPGLASESRSWW